MPLPSFPEYCIVYLHAGREPYVIAKNKEWNNVICKYDAIASFDSYSACYAEYQRLTK